MEKSLIFCTSAELVRVGADAVVFITADGNYSTITMADGSAYTLTIQLGQIERRIMDATEGEEKWASPFVRIGKSLIINRDYITLINPGRQRLSLSDGRTFRHEVTASREALKALKDLIEKEK